jgi:hypothetical protein
VRLFFLFVRFWRWAAPYAMMLRPTALPNVVAMNAVPFQYDEVLGGLANCQGLIRIDGKDLCLEFQVQDAVVGVFKSPVKEIRIPIRDLSSVELERRWFGLSTKLAIQANRLETVQDIPGMKQGRLLLHIARRDRPAARRLVAELSLT